MSWAYQLRLCTFPFLAIKFNRYFSQFLYICFLTFNKCVKLSDLFKAVITTNTQLSSKFRLTIQSGFVMTIAPLMSDCSLIYGRFKITT